MPVPHSHVDAMPDQAGRTSEVSRIDFAENMARALCGAVISEADERVELLLSQVSSGDMPANRTLRLVDFFLHTVCDLRIGNGCAQLCWTARPRCTSVPIP